MNILMINLPFAGHTNPTLPLTAELVKRGHHVTYMQNIMELREKYDLHMIAERFVNEEMCCN